jgi:hypothetical protein
MFGATTGRVYGCAAPRQSKGIAGIFCTLDRCAGLSFCPKMTFRCFVSPSKPDGEIFPPPKKLHRVSIVFFVFVSVEDLMCGAMSRRVYGSGAPRDLKRFSWHFRQVCCPGCATLTASVMSRLFGTLHGYHACP